MQITFSINAIDIVFLLFPFMQDLEYAYLHQIRQKW